MPVHLRPQSKVSKTVAGQLLYYELLYRGEAQARRLKHTLSKAMDVSERTLTRWRLVFEETEALPPPTARAVAQRERRQLKTGPPASSSGNGSGVSQVESVEPSEVIPPPRPERPATNPANRPEQLAFDWPPRLVDAINAIPAERLGALAEAVERWWAAQQAKPAPRRTDVTPNFRK